MSKFKIVYLIACLSIACAACVPESKKKGEDSLVLATGGMDDSSMGAGGTDGTGGTDEAGGDVAEVTKPACDDGEDNDGDGDIDLDDKGCDNAQDRNEGDEPVAPQCSDGKDNDDDGLIDFPDDPGCGSDFDSDETDEVMTARPQCSNGRDDDSDGLVDIADPGCTSPADPREVDSGEPVQCVEDADCNGVGTCVQSIGRCLPACSNGQDDDGDGVIDFPYEPGCSAAGDDNEEDPEQLPLCGNDFDDDSDGKIDYPNDPGCAGVGDRDETDPAIQPHCGDGRDNDNDGLIDYPEDRGCESAADATEGGACGRQYEAVEVTPGVIIRGDSRQALYAAEGRCGGRGAPEVVLVYRVTEKIESFVVRTDVEGNEHQTTLHVRRNCLDPTSEVACAREDSQDGVAANQVRIDNPLLGDYYIFVDGAAGEGGKFAVIVEEVPLAQCLNGIDDDMDGQTDYPFDPGCSQRNDRDETTPDPLPTCFDGMDNDFDGQTDFPFDAGCISAADKDEADPCGQGLRISAYPVGQPFIVDRTDDMSASNQFAGTCGAAMGPEKVYLYENPHNAKLDISVNFPETIEQTIVYVRRVCVDPRTEEGCSGGEEMDGRRGSITIPQASPGDYYIFVDHPFGVGGVIKLAVTSERLAPGCSDEVDNDEDGFVDADDPGCESLDDEDERDEFMGGLLPACADNVDNDDDGLIDYPFDPGCVTKGGRSEDDPAEPSECNNGVDDDEDEAIDFPADSGCSSRGDPTEENGRRAPRCDNRIDDDMDGKTDYPNDPGCAARGDLSEQDDAQDPACADGADNDRDGLLDFPYDPGCEAAGDRDEADPDEAPLCSNGLDDDEDGITDFPLDPGCVFAADGDEADPAFPAQCSNMRMTIRMDALTFPTIRDVDLPATRPSEPMAKCEPAVPMASITTSTAVLISQTSDVLDPEIMMKSIQRFYPFALTSSTTTTTVVSTGPTMMDVNPRVMAVNKPVLDTVMDSARISKRTTTTAVDVVVPAQLE